MLKIKISTGKLDRFTLLKIEYSEKMEDYLYNVYLREVGDKIEKKLSSLKEQSLVEGAKAYFHLKTLRIAPGNWRMVGEP